MRLILLLSVTSFAFGGCASLSMPNMDGLKPDLEPTIVETGIPAAEKTRWAENAPGDMPTTNWVESFSDPVLNRLVTEALDANAQILSSEAGVRAALSRLKASRASLLPTLNGSFDVSRSERASSLTPDGSSLGYGLSGSWEPDIWGRIGDGIDSAELSAQASQADYAGVRLAIAGQVAQAWFNTIEARLLTELAQRDVETQQRALRLTTRRFEGGVTGSSDVRLARSSLASSKAALAARQRSLAATTRSLEVLLNHYPANALPNAADLPKLPPLKGVGAPSYIIKRRPDLLAAERRMMAAGLDVDVARKALLPSFNLSSSLTGGGNAITNFLDFDGLVARLAAGLTAPLYQGGRLKANVETQRAVLDQLVHNYAGTALNAYLEVENALNAETHLAEQEAQLEISLEEATKAEDRLEARYVEGLATILQLLDAQSRRISAESQLISARKERLANRVRLHIALGGGIETQGALQLASQ